MTRLLVSVRSADEARAAIAGGADVIDVKEPSRGALGAADPAVWREVVDAVAGRAPVSVALGELRDFAASGLLDHDLTRLLRGVCWAKLGLAGCGTAPDWQTAWSAAISKLPAHIQSVAVVYADWRIGDAPPPEAVLEAAARAGLEIVLIDTYDKSAGRLLDHFSPQALEQLAARAREMRMKIALAGSLRSELFPALAHLAPDLIAVRGAACSGGRAGHVCEQLVRQLSSAVGRLWPAAALEAAANA